MTTRKRNLIIAAAVAAVIAAAAAITAITLNTQSEAEKVNNTLALMGDPNAVVSDITDNRNATVTVGGGSDNDTPIVIGETEDDTDKAADVEDILTESADAAEIDKGNAEKEDTPDRGVTSSAKPADSTKPANTSNSDYPEAPDQGGTSSSSKAQTDKPAVTVVTTAPAVTAPPSTVRNDLPEVTAEPKYTTAPTEKPAQTEPTVVEKYDSNGFPANPVSGQEYVDSNGQLWTYLEFVGWRESGSPTLQEFPDFYVEGGDEIILG